MALNRVVVWGTAAVLVAATAWWISSESTDQPQAVAPVARALSSAESVSAPISRPAKKSSPAVASEAQPSVTPDARSVEESAVATPREAPVTQQPASGSVNDLAARFSAEPSNSETGEQLRSEILDHLALQPGLTLTGINVECRESICHVELSGPNSEQKKAMEAIAALEGFDPSVPTARRGDGGVIVADTYLVRRQ